MNQSRLSGVYEEIHEYEAIIAKPPSSTFIQQWSLPLPDLPGTDKDKDVKLTPCPAYIPISFSPDGANGQYENIIVGQSSSGGKAAVEGEYQNVQRSLIMEEVSAVGQSSSGRAEATRGQYENVGQK